MLNAKSILYFFIFLQILFTKAVLAQNNCISLEGINLGCVSGIDHSCTKNKVVDDPRAPCRYVGDPSTMKRVEQPLAFHCKSSKNTTTCVDEQTPDGIKHNCYTSSECTEYQPPRCDETCIPCYNTVLTVNNGIARGCIVCTRKYCPDEPVPKPVCAPSYNGLTQGNGIQCSTNSRCPTTAIDPLGKTHNVTVTSPDCKPPELPPLESPAAPRYCPWISDTFRTPDKCEPIPEIFKNPLAK